MKFKQFFSALKFLVPPIPGTPQEKQVAELRELADSVEMPEFYKSRELLRFQIGCRDCGHKTTLRSTAAAILYIQGHHAHRTWFRQIEKYVDPTEAEQRVAA